MRLPSKHAPDGKLKVAGGSRRYSHRTSGQHTGGCHGDGDTIEAPEMREVEDAICRMVVEVIILSMHFKPSS